MDNYILINNDCKISIHDIPDKSVDLIITDPPYEFEKKHHSRGCFGRNNRKYHEEIDDMRDGISEELLNEFLRICKKPNIYIFCSKNQLLMFLNFCEKNDLNFEILTWHKTNPIPTCNNKYLSDTEYIFFFRGKGVKIYGNYNTKKKYFLTNVNKKDKKRYCIPTCKPLEIINNLVENSSLEGDIIFDPFMGSGSVAVSAINNKRKFIGIELDRDIYNIAKNRIIEECNE